MEELGLLGLLAELLGFDGGGGVADGEVEELDVVGGEAFGFVEGLEGSDDGAGGVAHGEDQHGVGLIAALLIDALEETRVLGSVVDEDGFAAGDTGPDDAGAGENAKLGDAVGDLGPELAGFRINEPEGTAIGAGEIAGHGGVEVEKSFGILGAADAGSVIKDHLGDAVVLRHQG